MADTMRAKVDQPNYRQGVSLMEMPTNRAEWEHEHRTARKRAWRAERFGYRFQEIDRSLYSADIHAINTSLDVRQGRPMRPGYTTYREQSPLPDYECDRHAIRTYGVLHGDTLVAYMTAYRLEQLVLVSMILGHGGHLRNDIMYLLWAGLIDAQSPLGGVIYYNRHDSGQDGLRYYKERVGLAACDVRWEL